MLQILRHWCLAFDLSCHFYHCFRFDVDVTDGRGCKAGVSVNTTSAHRPHRRPVFVDCHSRRLGIDRQCTGPFKNPKDGEKRRKTAKCSELRCNYENLSELVNKIYTSAERDRKFWWPEVAILLNVFWRLSSFRPLLSFVGRLLTVFRGLQLDCISPFYHTKNT